MAKKQKGLTAEQVQILIKATEALEKYAKTQPEPMCVVGYAQKFAEIQLKQLKGEFPL